MRLDHGTVVITGAGSGIGRALARQLSAAGCHVAICDHDPATLAETADLVAGPFLSKQLDVRDRQGQFAFAAEVARSCPRPILAVFNNAGVTVAQSIVDGAPEDDEWVIDVNYWGVVHGTRAFLPVLLEQGCGTIVNTSSVFGLIAWPGQAAYCASKHAVRAFTESLRHELHGTGVRAATVHPGGVSTNIARNARWHDLPGTLDVDHATAADLFERFTMTSPAKAAQIIVRGVEKQRGRILVGPDATAIDLIARVAPVSWYTPIRVLEPLVRRLLPA